METGQMTLNVIPKHLTGNIMKHKHCLYIVVCLGPVNSTAKTKKLSRQYFCGYWVRMFAYLKYLQNHMNCAHGTLLLSVLVRVIQPRKRYRTMFWEHARFHTFYVKFFQLVINRLNPPHYSVRKSQKNIILREDM